jgi:hypothetical protein
MPVELTVDSSLPVRVYVNLVTARSSLVDPGIEEAEAKS